MSWVGLAGAAGLHVLILHAVVLGSTARKVRPPPSSGAGSMMMASSDEPSMTVVFIEDDSPRPDDDSPMPLASNGILPKDPLVTIASPQLAATFEIATDAGDDPESRTSTAAGDPRVRAALFGRYVDQVSARVYRAWMRPRAPLDTSTRDAAFRCQVRIEQDAHGNVQEVQLLACNGGARWQRSIVTAIFRASPLSAPPDPAVFANVLTLTFESQPFRIGQSDQGYEPCSLNSNEIVQGEFSNACS